MALVTGSHLCQYIRSKEEQITSRYGADAVRQKISLVKLPLPNTDDKLQQKRPQEKWNSLIMHEKRNEYIEFNIRDFRKK